MGIYPSDSFKKFEIWTEKNQNKQIVREAQGLNAA
jgi:hypothetical protein